MPVPSGKDYQNLLQRISDGINGKYEEIQKMISHMHEMYGLEINKLETKLSNLTAEY